MLYAKYQRLFKNNQISTGFSRRLPDYADKYKFDLLEQSINQSNKNIFLDIGAGTGRLSALLINHLFKKGIALEIAPDKKTWTTLSKNNPNLTLITGLLQKELPIFIEQNKIKIDFVLLSEVFEHIPPKDIAPFLSCLQNIVSTNGKIFLTTPNSIVQGAAENSPRYYKKQKYGHYKHYSLKELKELLSKYNFQVDWYKFESGFFKRNFYNKAFYKTSRLDQKLLNSKKLPYTIRYIYKNVSLPFILITRFVFWLLSKLVYISEHKFNNEKNAETVVIQIKKISTNKNIKWKFYNINKS